MKIVFRKYIIIVLSIIIIMTSAFSLYKIKNLENKMSTIENNSSLNMRLNTLTVESFNKKVEKGKNTIFVYIGNGNCSDCSFFDPILIKNLKNRKIINFVYYVDCEYLHKKRKEWYSFKKKYNFDQTPCLMLFKNGKRVSKLEWIPEKGISEHKLVSWLDENSKLIKESI